MMIIINVCFSFSLPVMQQSAAEKDRGRSGQFAKRNYTFILVNHLVLHVKNRQRLMRIFEMDRLKEFQSLKLLVLFIRCSVLVL